jgi:hypothetical protein
MRFFGTALAIEPRSGQLADLAVGCPSASPFRASGSRGR